MLSQEMVDVLCEGNTSFIPRSIPRYHRESHFEQFVIGDSISISFFRLNVGSLQNTRCAILGVPFPEPLSINCSNFAVLLELLLQPKVVLLSLFSQTILRGAYISFLLFNKDLESPYASFTS